DQAGSGGAGAVGLALAGAGTVVLSASNSYTGGTMLQGGTLSLQAANAAGSGTIFFAYGSSDTLIVGPGDVPANRINGLLPGDRVDIQNIGTATSVTPSGDGLAITGGTIPVQLTLDPAQNLTGETFHVTGDGQGGTLLTVTDVNGDFPPSIAGTAVVAGDDHTSLTPLAGVTVSDIDPGQTETVTVALSSPANGTLSSLGGGAYDSGTGVYTVTGSTSQVTAALDALVFTPAIHQVAPGGTVSTQFSLSATDGLMTSTAAATTVNITALNDAPVINGVPSGLLEGYWNVPLNPFPTATIVDPDLGAIETVTLTLQNAGAGTTGSVGNGTLSLAAPVQGVTLTHTGSDAYSLSAASPGAVSAALDALLFTPVA
ncbi:MAG: autotransporter-associated beta strand repeat-containing protein, partial [Mycobacterium sp.]|nr:autotransporter-associated beta strand repeat-containing protein [Mycobacterium sp.]